MGNSERRRAERHLVDLPGELLLSGGRRVPVRVLNLGPLGALCEIRDLEEPLFEGERVLLDHPPEDAPAAGSRKRAERVRTAGAVVRVQLEFAHGAVSRHLAVHFDGGAAPEGVSAA